MKKLLITGASGFLGGNLGKIAASEWDIYGTYCAHPLTLKDVTLIPVDLTDFPSLKQLFAEVNPTAVIHTAAQSKPNFCQQYPEQSYRINVTASLNIAGLCADYNIPCVFTSTDLVFNGLNAPYKETDPVSPISYYGEQKVLAEEGMRKIYPKTAICRMPLMFGLSSPTAESFIQPWIKSLNQGKEINLFIDEFRTPVSGSTAARGLLLALEKVAGILHLGGVEKISRYQFGLLMAEVLQLPIDLIKSCRQKDLSFAAPRPADVSLDSSQALALGYNPLSLREELEIFKNSQSTHEQESET
ncbi:SDR family oxidoreductase [Gloeothece verrucosa]|uniref:dTDP-4-dehydrorhamnose reductase n=1 Tax=Gloeothece verrucosa (strain PCC 7822) TaxID=497965 RepID=E0UI36_GLOV7|nr:NAD(P)-dependent oxidoreductase [Gloeothece verrucosa]ADN15688.1 dTDP-4-dehydrorhamnose reductase [Gloeothece verrucosa PCC 7822]